MTTDGRGRSSGSMPWALGFAGLLAALMFVVIPVLDGLGSDEGFNRPVLVVSGTVLVLAPFALVWLVAEAHLRWSPRGRVARGLVGWFLVVATLAVLVWYIPFALYVIIMSLGVLTGS